MGRPKLTSKMETLSVRLSPAHLKDIDVLADEMKGPNTALRITRADVVRQLIEEALDARRRKRGAR